MEAGGVGICTRVENKQLIENTTRSKRTRLRIWRIGVRAVYMGIAAGQTLTKLRSKPESARSNIATRFSCCRSNIGNRLKCAIYFTDVLPNSL